MKLRKWQQEAVDAWNITKNGIVVAATGVGKTQVAVEIIKQLKCSTMIVVPTVALQVQWKETLNNNGFECGLVGDGHNDMDANIVIAVINSLRDKKIAKDLFVFDEIHRSLSEQNIRALINNYKHILCLTATLEREDKRHEILLKRVPVVYRYEQKEAIRDNVLSEYEIVNIGVDLTPNELIKYQRYDDIVVEHFREHRTSTFNFKKLPWKVMSAITRRRQLLMNAESKISKTIELLNQINYKKIIVFCEFIVTAKRIEQELKKIGTKCCIYTSKMKAQENKDMMKQFETDINIMISVRSLDEGIDVPSVDSLIIVGSSKVKRQNVQRFGRALRKQENKCAIIYQLYCSNTKDRDWLNTRMKPFYESSISVTWY